MERKTLSCYITEELEKKGLSQSNAASVAGIAKGHLNNCLKGVQRYTLEVVEKLIDKIGLDRFTTYELFSKEVFREDANKIKAKREELLKRCIEYGFTQLAESVAAAMLEEGSTAIGFYQIAEEYRLKGKEDDAVGLYNKAMSLETNRYSELLAMCLYRKFSILRDRDFKIYDVALELSMHIENLPFFTEDEQATKLEAYRQLIASYHEIEQYDHAMNHCNDLMRLASLECCVDKRKAKRYHGLAQVYKGFAAKRTGDYQLALEMIDQYETNDTDDFANWAAYNRLEVQVVMGMTEKIPTLIDYIRQNSIKNSAIVIAIGAYMRYNMFNEVRGLIIDNQEQIDALLNSDDMFYRKWAAELNLHLSAFYRLHDREQDAKSHLIEAMKSAISLGQQDKWFECIKEYNAHHITKNIDHSEYFGLVAESGRLFSKG